MTSFDDSGPLNGPFLLARVPDIHPISVAQFCSLFSVLARMCRLQALCDGVRDGVGGVHNGENSVKPTHLGPFYAQTPL